MYYVCIFIYTHAFSLSLALALALSRALSLSLSLTHTHRAELRLKELCEMMAAPWAFMSAAPPLSRATFDKKMQSWQ